MDTYQKTIKAFKSVGEMFRFAGKNHQFTLQNIMDGIIYSDIHGHVNFIAPDGLLDEIATCVACDIVGGHSISRKAVLSAISGGHKHWTFEKFIVTQIKNKKGYYVTYAMGRDMTAETNKLRRWARIRSLGEGV